MTISKHAVERIYVSIVLVIYCIVILLNAQCFKSLLFVQQVLKFVLFLCYVVAMLQTFAWRMDRGGFRLILNMFIGMLVLYGIFSSHFNLLFPCLNVLLVFYFFYRYSVRGIITMQMFKKFILCYFLVVGFLFYDALIFKLSYVDSLELSGGMNVGYDILAFMVMAMFFYKERRYLFLLLVAYVLILFALKRGAVVCATVILIPLVWKYLKMLFFYKKVKFVCFLIILVFGFSFVLWEYQDVLFHRFDVEELRSGSGRNTIYSTIYNSYVSQTSFLRLLFGNGFFASADIPYGGVRQHEGFYAHSDFYELLWDHGLFGVMLYMFMILVAMSSLFGKYDKHVLRVFFLVWLIQACISGVYTVLEGRVYFLLLGYLIGNLSNCTDYDKKYCKKVVANNAR